MRRRDFLRSGGAALAFTLAPAVPKRTSGERLARAVRAQLGVTTGYDPNYTRIGYPGGDVSRTTGVCADVVVRAARDGLGLDLQQLLHEDMARNFSAYPHTWGLHAVDANIDHRRVLNLEVFWRRAGASLWTASAKTAGDDFPTKLEVGDLLTWLLGGKLPHIGIVVERGPGAVPEATRVVHNIGRGVEESPLLDFHGENAKGHVRWPVA